MITFTNIPKHVEELLDKNPHPTDAQIRAGMAGTLCRCMTYYRIQAAIKRAVKATGKEVVA